MPYMTEFQSTSTYGCTSYEPPISPVGSSRPHRVNDNDPWANGPALTSLDWGTGDGESGGSVIGAPDGYHGAEATPVGGAVLPLMLCLMLYVLFRRCSRCGSIFR